MNGAEGNIGTRHLIARTMFGPPPGTNVWLLHDVCGESHIRWWDGTQWAETIVPSRALGRGELPAYASARVRATDSMEDIRRKKLLAGREVIGGPEGFYWHERFRERKPSKKFGVPSSNRDQKFQRNVEIRKMRLNGYSLAKIAARFSLSRERVRQITDGVLQ